MRNLCGLNLSVCRFDFIVPTLNEVEEEEEEEEGGVIRGGARGRTFTSVIKRSSSCSGTNSWFQMEVNVKQEQITGGRSETHQGPDLIR